SWCSSWPYRWLAERSVRKGRRKLIHRESFRASVLHLSEIQAVLQSISEKNCLLTTPSFLSSGTQPHVCARLWPSPSVPAPLLQVEIDGDRMEKAPGIRLHADSCLAGDSNVEASFG